MAITNFLNCPEDCDTDVLLPAISQEQDCTSWIPKDSQVCDLFIRPTGAPDPFDWTDPDVPIDAETIDNTEDANANPKRLVGEGGVSIPEKQIVDYPKKKSRITSRDYTLSMRFRNLTDEMYAFLRQFQCGWTNFTFYYATVGGRLFGKEDLGVPPLRVDVDFPLGEGRDDKEEAVLTITWNADADPDRWANPFA
jgi:hypothetical protein